MLIRTTKTAAGERKLETGPANGQVVTAEVDRGSGTRELRRGPAEAPSGARPGMWAAVILAISTVVALATVTITAERDPGQQATEAASVSGPAVGTQEFLNRLAEQGYIPREAVDQKRLLLERAVERGDIPAATLDERSGVTNPPSTAHDRLLLGAVRSGQVPRAALDADHPERLDDGTGSRE